MPLSKLGTILFILGTGPSLELIWAVYNTFVRWWNANDSNREHEPRNSNCQFLQRTISTWPSSTILNFPKIFENMIFLNFRIFGIWKTFWNNWILKTRNIKNKLEINSRLRWVLEGLKQFFNVMFFVTHKAWFSGVWWTSRHPGRSKGVRAGEWTVCGQLRPF